MEKEKLYAEMLIALMENIPDSIYFKNREGRFLMVSRKKAENSNTTCEEMIGKTDFDFLSLEEAEVAYFDDKLVIETGQAIQDKIEKLTRADGKEIYNSVSKTPWKDRNGNIIGLIGISRDITKRMEIEKQILNMLTIATHEIRGPLASINATIKLLKKGSYGFIDESVKVTLEELYQRVRRLEKIVNDYLHKSSFFNLKDLPNKETWDLRQDIIDPVLEELSEEIEQNQIIIDNKLGGIPGNAITIKANKLGLRIVYKTLIGNAIKYGGRGGKIAIGFEDKNDYFKFIVYNNGPAIPKNEQEKIFEKFYSSGDSTGIGLYIAKKIIKKHKGEIWYEEALDGHPQFVFTLPK